MTQSIWIDNATHPTIALVYQVGCRWCKKQAQDLAKLSQSHSVNTVLIGMGASSRDLKTELRHFPSHLSAKEANRELLTQIKGVEAVPTTLYISPQGELIYKHRGYIPSATYLQVGRDYIVSKGAVGAPQ
ncbi:TlpA family protein disulfide reductase [Echinimonas agarilytica]|uniref:Thioredoxin fold domain-containing protein n=1 Tax=Echinimonas agarilytica TaxID=1215918 RepID=A0AA41W3Q9_9GAMM|nr:thioredoxin fold domain-containing protein [Echinimonas agarilytica]MCM2678272.1 thioredoxin fold domain-containing protein [Echinimonas agarilytica]